MRGVRPVEASRSAGGAAPETRTVRAFHLDVPVAALASVLLGRDGTELYYVDRFCQRLMWAGGGRPRIVLPDLPPGYTLLCAADERLCVLHRSGRGLAFTAREGIASCPIDLPRLPSLVGALTGLADAAARDLVQVRVGGALATAEAALPRDRMGELDRPPHGSAASDVLPVWELRVITGSRVGGDGTATAEVRHRRPWETPGPSGGETCLRNR